MLKPRFHTVLNAQRRSPNFLSTVSYSDLSTERPNPEYAQDHAQRRTQAGARGYKAVLGAHVQLRAQTQMSCSAENAGSRWL